MQTALLHTVETVAAAMAVAGLLALFQAASGVDPSAITDWHSYAVGVGGNIIRAAAGAAIKAMTS